MTDKSFLQWIHDRLVKVHNENVYVDYLHKLRAVINSTDDSKETPNTCSFIESSRIIEFIMPDGVLAYSRPIARIKAKEALKITSGKWVIDDDFSGEDSFFTDNKRNFCRCRLKKA